MWGRCGWLPSCTRGCLCSTWDRCQIRRPSRSEVATGGPEDESQRARSDAWSALVDVLGSLAAHGNRLGVQLAAYAPNADPQQLQRLVSELPEGALGVDLSPAPLVAARGSALDFVNVLGPHIVHVHGNDAVRDLRSHQGVEVELGRGSADYPELLGRLEEFGYRGWITLVRQHSERQLQDLDNAVRYLAHAACKKQAWLPRQPGLLMRGMYWSGSGDTCQTELTPSTVPAVMWIRRSFKPGRLRREQT